MRQIDRSTRVLLDSSVLVAGAGRPEGGSGFLLSVCRRALLTAVVSHLVLIEAEENVVEKFDPLIQARFHRLVTEMPMVVAIIPDAAARAEARAIVGEKDDHVLAAALAGEARYLVTLDRRLMQAVNAARLPVRAFRPVDFILGILTAHQEYDRLREE